MRAMMRLLRNTASSSVVDVKISFNMIMLFGVASVKIA